jgi:CheY-like chemotaxis protein
VLRPRVLDLNGVVSGLEPMLRRTIGEDIGFDVKLDPEPWLVKVDRTQMEQVILNLAVNARDAMPEGGRLAIETQKVQILPEDASRYPDAPPGCYAVLTVSDTGVGMSPEILSHVFEPFFTTKEPGKGTGLGLSTVYGIVRQSNGHVWVESEPLRGTTFRICLPRAEGKAEPITTVIPVIPPAKGSETVLLVEDADVVRKLAHEVLRRNGYKVIEATDGRTAVDLAARHAGPIHLLLTDLVMPEMSGRQLANYLAAARPDLRILYMSGYAEDAVARQGRIDPGAAFVPKPFTPADLARKVRETLDAPRRS